MLAKLPNNNIRFPGYNWSEKLAYILLFLFPIAGNSIKSWTGILFFLLFFISIFKGSWCKQKLFFEEKVLLLIITGIFLIWILSGISNGWGDNQTKGLGIQIRALLFIPIYLLVRQKPLAFTWLARGCIAAAIVLLLQCLHDIYWLKLDRGYGQYDSPGLIAIQALVFMGVLAAYFWHEKDHFIWRKLIFLGIACSFASLVLSGSRSTYVTVLILLPVISLLFFGIRKTSAVLAVATITIVFLYVSVDIVQTQALRASEELTNYFSDPKKLTSVHGSVGTRLELWRAALLVGWDNLMFGVGWRNFYAAAHPLAEQGLVNVSAISAPHPHNLYLEFLVTAGVPGLVLLIMLFVYPLLVAQKFGEPIGKKLLVFYVLSFAINGINEGGSLIYGNALSFFLIFLAIIFANVTNHDPGYSPRCARQTP